MATSFPGSPKAEQDANFARFTTQALLQYSQRSPIWIRLHVDVEIFEPRKKKLRIQKYPDTCGPGLNYINVVLLLVSSLFQDPSSSSSSSSSKLHRSVSFSYVGKKCLQRNGRKLTFPLFWVKPVPSYLDRIMGELSAKQAQKWRRGRHIAVWPLTVLIFSFTDRDWK